jgi:hypothetical protein
VVALFAAQAIGRRLGWEYHCPHCGFDWPLLGKDGLARTLRDRVVAALLERGFKAVAPDSGELFRLEGEVEGRRAVIIQRDQVGPGRLQISLAVSHGGTLTDGERGEILGAGAKLERAIDDLVRQRLFESLSLGDGELRLALRASPVAARDMGTLLRVLAEAAPSFERVRLEVHGFERRAFARAGVPRCAYCHVDVSGTERDLVACERCSTVLHEACWEELGHCPVLGCTGREHAREREIS